MDTQPRPIRAEDRELSVAIDRATQWYEEAQDPRVRNAFHLALLELMRCAAELQP